jgi:predicted acyltransferase
MNRNPAIDLYRGLAIVLMILANYLAGAAVVPAWLKHAPDAGLTVIDLIAPFFIFAIGLTYGPSARRRFARDGWRAAAAHFGLRYLALIGIGCLLSTGEMFFGLSTSGVNWGVLQAIGVAGLVTLAFIRLPAWVRAVVGLALLAAYQAALELGLSAVVLSMPHGGLPGAVSWTAMLLLATALADLYQAGARQGRLGLAAGSAAALLLGLGLAVAGLVISKNRVSSPYVLISLGASGMLFGLVDLAATRLHSAGRELNGAFALLAAWGRNPLLLYLLQDLGLAFFFLPPFPGWYAQAPAWLVALQAAALVAALSAAAWRLRSLRFIL